MKTTRFFRLATILLAVVAISVAGCKKDRDDEKPDTNSMQQLSKDANEVQSASDDAMDDANTVLSGGSGKGVDSYPCNVTIDSSSVVNDTITYSLTFNGLNCAGTFFRQGNATIKRAVDTYWHQAGTVVTVNFINLKITRMATGKFVILNGTKSFENVSGGLLIDLGAGYNTIVHKMAGSLSVEFEDGTTRTWNVARQRSFSGEIGQLVVTEEAYGEADGYTNLLFYGTNRDGESFYTQITQAIVFKQSCNFDPVSGILIHQIPADDNKKATATFGYDDNNVLITGDDCPTRYKIDWVKGEHSGTLFLELH